MSNVEAIEKAVRDLPPPELARFRSWFARFDAATWDAQIDADAAAGKLDSLAAEAFDEHRAGRAREI